MYKAVHLIGVVGLALTLLRLRRGGPGWSDPVAAWGVGWLALGCVLGLTWVPREAMMGDVGRILYVHVPAAWIAMVVFTLGFGAAIAYLWTGDERYDWVVESATEVGIVMNALLLALGSIFGRPTWNTWWTWDPRLTASLVMLITFIGVMLLRQQIQGDRRATWSAVATILAYANIPFTYMVVRWMPSLHQSHSTPDTVDPSMAFVLRMCAWGLLFLAVGFVARRWTLARAYALAERPPALG